jgi:hypothetical protein
LQYNLPHFWVKQFELTERLVDHPDEALEEITQSARARRFNEMQIEFDSIAEQWAQKNGIRIRLQPEAARLLSQKALDSGDKMEDIFSSIFKDYEHGLNLIREAQGSQQFEITADVVRDSKPALDKYIRALYVGRQ